MTAVLLIAAAVVQLFASSAFASFFETRKRIDAWGWLVLSILAIALAYMAGRG